MKTFVTNGRESGAGTEEKLRFQLQQPEGFSSYGEVQLWLKGLCGMDIPYATVYKYVRTRIKTKLKKLN
ncbi:MULTISPECIES: hypothetical protein [unclassified Moorena]|uniref:hypothetical protein n=1 Tax=unclassified Moorena TaxID=2683338 RepID=UPI00140128CD|nr:MULTISPECIES: hypothetical protein [unclassified Moorena]NEO11524.1 hypothetical protein [Moorena sp. SIO3E8]NEP97984.1 hypothetical protein [Moorena sp. SIO3F7]